MKLIAVLVSVLFVLTALMTFSIDALAEDAYYITYCPSANNATWWSVYPRYATDPAETTAPCIHADFDLLDVYSSTTATKYAMTNDFTSTSWNVTGYDGGFTPYYYEVGWLPGENATLLSVNVIAIFQSAVPSIQLQISGDNQSTWALSPTFPESGGGISPFYAQTWNCTSAFDWNYSLLNSTDVWVKAKMTPVPGTHYYLEYLGLYVSWMDDLGEEGGAVPDDPGGDAGESPGYYIIYTPGGIIGVLGLVGFGGMIATPAILIYANRQSDGDGKMNLFVKGIVMFMFFLTFFMVSITS